MDICLLYYILYYELKIKSFKVYITSINNKHYMFYTIIIILKLNIQLSQKLNVNIEFILFIEYIVL